MVAQSAILSSDLEDKICAIGKIHQVITSAKSSTLSSDALNSLRYYGGGNDGVKNDK